MCRIYFGVCSTISPLKKGLATKNNSLRRIAVFVPQGFGLGLGQFSSQYTVRIQVGVYFATCRHVFRGVKFIYRTICGIELGVSMLHSLPALAGQFYYGLTLLAKRVFVDSLSWVTTVTCGSLASIP